MSPRYTFIHKTLELISKPAFMADASRLRAKTAKPDEGIPGYGVFRGGMSGLQPKRRHLWLKLGF
jgi:hypothetical protein